MNRRTFLQTTLIGGAAAAAGLSVSTSGHAESVAWPIGCFNRPWTSWSFDDALKQIKSAGYGTMGLLTRTKEEPFIGADASAEYSSDSSSGLLKAAEGQHGRASVAPQHSTRGVDRGSPQADRQRRRAGLDLLLTFGVDRPEEYDYYYKVMSDAAAYAQEHQIKLVMKPHGGSSGASDEIQAVMKAVNHPNFKIWYNAGNIIYYTGKDPVEELKPIARHVTGFCAKDCAAVKSDVMIQFGTGKVDFAGVFATLKAAGFDGPVMVECCKIDGTAEQTGANARANREFLEAVFAKI